MPRCQQQSYEGYEKQPSTKQQKKKIQHQSQTQSRPMTNLPVLSSIQINLAVPLHNSKLGMIESKLWLWLFGFMESFSGLQEWASDCLRKRRDSQIVFQPGNAFTCLMAFTTRLPGPYEVRFFNRWKASPSHVFWWLGFSSSGLPKTSIGFIVFLPMILEWNLPEASAALAHGYGDTQQLGDKLFSNFDWKHLPHIEAFVVKESGSALDVQFVETPLLNLKSRMKDCPNSCISPRFQDLLHLKWFWKMIYKPFVCSSKSK